MCRVRVALLCCRSLTRERCARAAQFQPATIGQASRLGGVSPADVTGLILHLELEKRQRAAAEKRAAGGAPDALAAPEEEPEALQV